MANYSIYLCTSPSGKHYVGKTQQSVEKRINKHKQNAKYGSSYQFHQAIRKYGIENFTVSVIVSNIPEYLVNPFERFWIHFYKSFTHGYNMTEGGDGRPLWTEEQKQKVSTANKGFKHSKEARAKMSKSHTGKVLTIEHRQAMSITHKSKNKKLTNAQKLAVSKAQQKSANVYKYDLVNKVRTTTLIVANCCLFHFAKLNNYNYSHLTATANNKRNHTGGIYAIYN